MSRSYEQRARADAAARRRSDVVEAARQLIATQGMRGLSLEAVAVAAGVTRKTVYNQFGAKAGLLTAVLDQTAERAGVERLHEASTLPDPAAAATALIGATCGFWAADRVVFRRLVGLAAIDQETGEAIAERERGRAREWAGVVARLAGAGRLRPAVTQQTAALVLAQLTAFPLFDGLDAGPDEAAALLVRLAGAVVRLDPTGSRGP